jgi:hypothetical protein
MGYFFVAVMESDDVTDVVDLVSLDDLLEESLECSPAVGCRNNRVDLA